MAFSLNSEHIIFEDNDILVVNKPENLLSVPGLSEPNNLFDEVTAYHPNARIVHRLDMPTSGLIIFALNPHTQKDINKQFEVRGVLKKYEAVVDGHITSHSGYIDAPMICDWPNRPRQKIDWCNGKSAQTFYRVINHEKINNSELTRVELSPHTGRSHQLRLHMYHLGFPIYGDTIYNKHNDMTQKPLFTQASIEHRLYLHARNVQFIHPQTKKALKLYSPTPF